MTLDELQAKRDEIIQTLGIVSLRYGDRSVQYADQLRALAAIDAEIQRLTASGSETRSVSYAEFNRG